jgi:hypothetical protein
MEMIPAASLSKDSPSKIVIEPLGNNFPRVIADTAITRGKLLPKGSMTILEGESLLNDAAGIISFKIAVTALVTGTFSLFQAVLLSFKPLLAVKSIRILTTTNPIIAPISTPSIVEMINLLLH